jgi:hypothetical protein
VPKTDPVKEVTKDADAPMEKKSMFATLCSCMGGSAPPKDVDKVIKEGEDKVVEEAEKVISPEKEEVEEA